MKKRSLSMAALAAAAMLALTACSTTDPAATEGTAAETEATVDSVLFDFPFTSTPVYAAIAHYAQERADETGVRLEMTNANGDLAEQVSQLTAYLNRDVDAVVSFPVDAASLETLAEEFTGSGRYWVSYANSVAAQDAKIDLNAYEAGYALGEHAGNWINETQGGKAQVLVIDENTMEFSRQRSEGLVAGLTETAPEATIVSQQPGYLPEHGLSITTAVLAQHPDLNVVLAVAGDAAAGAYQAMTTGGRDSKDPNTYVGGVDGNAFGFERIAEGTFFKSLASVSAKVIGYAVIDVPLKLAAGEKDPSVVIPVNLVTADSPDLQDLITEFSG